MVIKSCQSDAILEFAQPRGEYVEVSLSRHDLHGRRVVWLYTDGPLIADLFRSMAGEWRGWPGVKCWKSVEGELSLTASHDSIGHITLWVTLGTVDYEDDEPWKIETALMLEPGMLDGLAQDSDARFRQGS